MYYKHIAQHLCLPGEGKSHLKKEKDFSIRMGNATATASFLSPNTKIVVETSELLRTRQTTLSSLSLGEIP